MFSMENEQELRVGFFIGILGIMAVWEMVAPRRKLTTSKMIRWVSNLGITFLNTVIVRVAFPVLAIESALIAERNNWGLFNVVPIPEVAAGILAVIALDFIIYVQHVLFHMIPLFWRLHKMHHYDLDIDVTTGSRFHPVEILMSMGVKVATITLLGASAWAVLVFEILLNATAMFNHANAYVSLGIDKVLRLFIVTPDMHRVHHSVIIRETNSNYGFNLPWWDRIFGTYRPQPVKGHTGMTIGLANFRDARQNTLPWMLAIPFNRKER